MADFRFQQRDFLGILNDLKSYVRERIGDNWNDFSESDPTVAILEAYAFSLKNLHYYVDQQKRESDIVTAVRPRNVYWKSVRDGYIPHGRKAASGTLSIKFAGNTLAGVTIPKHSVFQTNFSDASQNKTVTTMEDQTISSTPIDVERQSVFDISVFQGQWKTLTKTRKDVTQNGYIKLPNDKTCLDIGFSEFVFHRSDGEDVVFEQTDDVYTEYREGNFYSMHPLYLRDTVTTMVQLPYNWEELLDTDGEITIGYLETDGDEGFIAASSGDVVGGYSGGVSEINQNLYDDAEPRNSIMPLVESVFNAMPISGGVGLENVESIKMNVKSSIRSLETLVTLEDYEDFVRMETGTNVSALDISTDQSIPPRCIYIVTELGGESSEGLKPFEPSGGDTEQYIFDYKQNEDWNIGTDLPHSYSEFWANKFGGIVDKVERRKGRRDLVVFMGPSYKDYSVEAVITLDVSGDSPETIMDNIRKRFATEFSSIPQIGKTHYVSNMISILQKSSDRVVSVDLLTPDSDVATDNRQIPRYRIGVGKIRFKFIDGSQDVLLPDVEIVG